MDEPSREEIQVFAAAALKELALFKPNLEGILGELRRQQLHIHDHEHFMITEFRSLTRAIDELNATLIRLAA